MARSTLASVRAITAKSYALAQSGDAQGSGV